MAYKNYKDYNPAYKPGQKSPYKISRSKIELFMRCPRCFWLDARLKIKQPAGPPFNINKAIDELLKKEFDSYRHKNEPHPLMIEHEISAVPFAHDKLDEWRETFVGVQFMHEPTNLQVYGAIDDVWVNDAGELMVVDYKATAKDRPISIDAPWQIGYKRQLEVYQWLLRQNGFRVNNTGYFVYCNGRIDLDGFNNRVEFTSKILPYTGSDVWVEPTLAKIKQCLEGDMPPVGESVMGGACEFCAYARERTKLTLQALQKNKTPNQKK